MAEDDRVFIDVQGFKANGDVFIVKEFALSHGDFVYHTTMKSPYEFESLLRLYQREANWLTYNHHGLVFDSGETELVEMIQHTVDHVRGNTVIVKGEEKVKWMKAIYNKKNGCGYDDDDDERGEDIDCVNVERYHSDFRFEPKRKSEISAICPYHTSIIRKLGCHCALSHVQQMKEFYLN